MTTSSSEQYLNKPLTDIGGVGTANAKKLERLGIFRIRDLLYHFPWRYDDLSTITPLAEVRPGGAFAVRAEIREHQLRQSFRSRSSILQTLIRDDTGSIVIVWFNQPYMQKTLQIGKTYLFAGEISFYKTLQMQNPVWEEDGRHVNIGRIVPVYPLTAGIYPKWLRAVIGSTLKRLPPLADHLPGELTAKYRLPSLDWAMRAVHFPENKADAERARGRFAFDELFSHQIKIISLKKRAASTPGISIPFNQPLIKSFIQSLPYTLTLSQKRAAWDVLRDLGRPHPANRLISGDVGSGKTTVAAIAAYQTISAGYAVALMVPTEILAAQHFATFCRFSGFERVRVAALTSGIAATNIPGHEKTSKKTLVSMLRDGNVDLVIGTHALIQKNVNFERLGLIIIDEQHRFGVQQRAELVRRVEGRAQPHFVSMTATPIPRTLALTVCGDLDVSRITELPSGRRKIETALVRPQERPAVYAKIDEMLAEGQQAFIICPLIDPSDQTGIKSATEEYERIRIGIFSHRRIGLLHGRLSSAEKNAVLAKFGSGSLDILVSTTVVEVGIDFPNATMMIIEGAERFGLAQLHQLRGRVGRSSLASRCYLLPTSSGSKSEKRLRALCDHYDGLQLAEIDLRLRGPGDVYGRLQAGYLDFKIADLFDQDLLTAARDAAGHALQLLEVPGNNVLRQEIKNIQSSLHLE